MYFPFKKYRNIFLTSLLFILVLIGIIGCRTTESDSSLDEADQYENDSDVSIYQLSLEENKALAYWLHHENPVIVDVRTAEEHEIPFSEDNQWLESAIWMPLEEIKDEPLAFAPDLDQIIMVYGLNYKRSREGVKKLISIGYTNVVSVAGDPTYKFINEDEPPLDDAPLQLLLIDNTAKKYWMNNDYPVIIDVRSDEEHELPFSISDQWLGESVWIPLEEIGNEPLSCAPDLNQMIMVYALDHKKSLEGAEKLISIGYTNVVSIVADPTTYKFFVEE